MSPSRWVGLMKLVSRQAGFLLPAQTTAHRHAAPPPGPGWDGESRTGLRREKVATCIHWAREIAGGELPALLYLTCALHSRSPVCRHLTPTPSRHWLRGWGEVRHHAWSQPRRRLPAPTAA